MNPHSVEITMFHHLWWSKFPFFGVNKLPDFWSNLWSNLCPPSPCTWPPGHFRSPDGLHCGHRLAVRPAALRHRWRLRRPRQRAQRAAGGAGGGQALGDGHGADAPGGENMGISAPMVPSWVSVERKHFNRDVLHRSSRHKTEAILRDVNK